MQKEWHHNELYRTIPAPLRQPNKKLNQPVGLTSESAGAHAKYTSNAEEKMGTVSTNWLEAESVVTESYVELRRTSMRAKFTFRKEVSNARE